MGAGCILSIYLSFSLSGCSHINLGSCQWVQIGWVGGGNYTGGLGTQCQNRGGGVSVMDGVIT